MGVPGLFAWLVKKGKNTNFVFTKNIHIPNIIMHDINNMDYLLMMQIVYFIQNVIIQ